MARWRRGALVVALWAFAATLAQAQPVLGDVSLYTDDFTFDPFPDLPADFGPAIPDDGIDGLLLMADPEDACEEFSFSEFGEAWVALIARAQRPHPTNCTFDVKVRNAEKAGASAAIVFDDAFEALIIMSKPPGNPEPGIPSVFVSAKAGLVMRKLLVPGSTRVHLTPVSAIAWMSMVMSAFLGFLALTVVIATFYVMRSWSAWLGRTRTRRGAPGELTYVLLHGPDAAGMSSAAIHALPTIVYAPRGGGKRQRAAARRRGAAGLVCGGGGAGDALTERLLPATAEGDEGEESGLLPRTGYDAAAAQGHIEAAGGGSGSLPVAAAAAGSQRHRRRRRGQQRGGGGGGGAPFGGQPRPWGAAAAAAEDTAVAHDGGSDAAAAGGAAAAFPDGRPASPGDDAACESDGALSSSSGGSGGSSSGADGAAAGGLPPGSRGGATRRTCVICLERYRAGEAISILPCSHRFHVKCVSSWLAVRRFCPVCKRDASEPPPAAAAGGGGGGAGASGAGAGAGAAPPRGAMLQVWLSGLRARLRRAAAAGAEGGGGGGGIPLAVAVDPGIVVALVPEAPIAAAAVAAAAGGRLDIEEGGGGGGIVAVPGATSGAAAPVAPGPAAPALPGPAAAAVAGGAAGPSPSADFAAAAAAPSVVPAGTSGGGAGGGVPPPTSGLRGRGARAGAARDAGMM